MPKSKKIVGTFSFEVSGAVPMEKMQQAINRHFLDGDPNCNYLNEAGQIIPKDHPNYPKIEKAHWNIRGNYGLTLWFDLTEDGDIINIRTKK